MDSAATSAVLKLVEVFQKMLGVTDIAPPQILWTSKMAPKRLGAHIVSGLELAAIAEGKPARELRATMELHRSILTNESTLARVIAHETIHHVEMGTMTSLDARKFRAGFIDPTRGHGTFFTASAKKINDHVGHPEFVTVTSDASYERATQSEKPYFLFITKLGEQYGYAWLMRVGSKSREYITKSVEKGVSHFVVTTDLYWSEKGIKFQVPPRVSMPIDKERMLELKALFEGGNRDYSLAQIRMSSRDTPGTLGTLPGRPR